MTFDIYGLKIDIISDWKDLINAIEKDFSYFKTQKSLNKSAGITVEVSNENRSIDSYPEMEAVFSTPRNVCYYKDDISYIDYFGKGLTIYDRGKQALNLYSDDIYIAHEGLYQAILSLAGEYLDKKRFHRIHGLGIQKDGKALIIMLDSGSGKTELALKFLRSDQHDYRLISEDTPLMSCREGVQPFPLRLGIKDAEKAADFPEDMKVYFPRIEFCPKYLVDILHFKDRLADSRSKPWILISGKRSTFKEPRIVAISKLSLMRDVFKNLIMGLGVYQGMEFMLKKSPFDILKKSGVVWSRFITAAVLVLKAKTFRIVLSKDSDKNYTFLCDFIEEQHRGLSN